jgi:uncharacterized protein (TIGR03000 family)
MFQSGKWILRIVMVTALVALVADSVSAGPLRDRLAARGGRAGYSEGGRRGYRGGYNGGMNGAGYGSPYGASDYPGYYPDNNAVIGATNGYQSNYYTPANNMMATINVRVVPDALVFFDDEPTKQSGEMRRFTSPPLNPGNVYHYTVRVKWDDNGKAMEDTRKIEVRAGRPTVVDFLRPETAPKSKQDDK